MTDAFTLRDALTQHRAGNLDRAQAMYEALLRIDASHPDTLHLLGVLHNARANYPTGIMLIERAVALAPQMAEAHYNLGNALVKAGRPDAAAEAYRRALEEHPAHVNAAMNLGDVHREQSQYAAAEKYYRLALAAQPDSRTLLVRLGVVLRAQRRSREAAHCYRAAIAIEPAAGDANYNLANVLFDQGSYEEALDCYAAAARSPSPDIQIPGMMLSCVMHTCDWTSPYWPGTDLAARHDEQLTPLAVLNFSPSLSEQRHFAAKIAVARQVNLRAERLRTAPNVDGRLRIGYLSSDYHQHATAYLIAELFEQHDRARFEIVGISAGPDDGSAVRSRLLDSFDAFLDIAALDDRTAAQRIAQLKLDILVDLKGYTKHAREGILGYRPAPLQVSYLGYPGTLACDSVDYIIGDRTVLPFVDQPYYSEQIVQLPHCYQVNDSKIRIATERPTRAQHGLPENAFVFCCFNANQKLMPSTFAAWMAILAEAPGSVLWLYRANDSAGRNLRAAAARHGIDPDRLVFAPSQAHSRHLTRYLLADLFLDTLPYNAHTTASDALRTGLPVLTLRGTTFAGRVAASLLETVGVPELIAETPQQYHAIALRLAGDPAALRLMREKVLQGVANGPLFDAALFARHIEAAYTEMHRKCLKGEAPAPFAVAP